MPVKAKKVAKKKPSKVWSLATSIDRLNNRIDDMSIRIDTLATNGFDHVHDRIDTLFDKVSDNDRAVEGVAKMLHDESPKIVELVQEMRQLRQEYKNVATLLTEQVTLTFQLTQKVVQLEDAAAAQDRVSNWQNTRIEELGDKIDYTRVEMKGVESNLRAEMLGDFK